MLGQISMKQLLEAGVHFGHQKRRWNPKMKKYTYTIRNQIYIIDLKKTLRLIREAYSFVRDTVAGGGRGIFVGTKRQATEAIEKLHSTAKAHDRVMVVELMGRYAGWIALNSGVAAAADVILIPEIPFDIKKVCDAIMTREAQGHQWSIVVVAEGARVVGGTISTIGEREAGREVRLGGIGNAVAEVIAKCTGKETRTLVLGHLQRGGNPTTFDKLLALRFGAAAVRFLAEGKFGHMVALDPPTVKAVPIKAAISKLKTVPLDLDTVITARSLGICFGD